MLSHKIFFLGKTRDKNEKKIANKMRLTTDKTIMSFSGKFTRK